jgi:2-(1,2-epoxy-1,2-dihydrophenyl)acetyl-CoA isomerase
MDSDFFKVELVEAIARCSMNTPENMNALSKHMALPMIDNIKELLTDDSVRVIVIRGEGGNFCSGSDISLLGNSMDPAFLNEAMILMNSLLYELHESAKPVITEVDGYALGGGLGLALASDITYATERAQFCTGFIRIGAVLDMGSSYFLAERLGLAKAKEFAYTGDIMDSDEALRIGLINKVVHHEKISEEVMELAKKLVKRPAKALAWTKRALNRARHLDLQTAFDLEAHIQPIMLLSEEHKEAIRKFLDRK